MKNMLKLYALVLASLIAGSAYAAFAFSGPVQPPQRGEGASEISGWVVNDIRYELAADPGEVRSVSFTLDTPPSQASIQIGSGNSTQNAQALVLLAIRMGSGDSNFYTCLPQGNNRWQCQTPGVSVAELSELRVVATGN